MGFWSSYLKYLKPIDVEHAHDFVASFSLCLCGENFDEIRKLPIPWCIPSVNAEGFTESTKLKICWGITHFNAFVDPGNQPAKQTTVEIFGKCISGVVGLWTNAFMWIWRHKKQISYKYKHKHDKNELL